MAVPYHVHEFEIPTATKYDVIDGTSEDKAVVPASLGTAAASNAGDFADAAQGALADTALQPSDVAAVATSGDYDDLTNKPTLGSAAAADAGDFATAAEGVPKGGLPDQVLRKFSSDDNDCGWDTVPSTASVSYAPQSLSNTQMGQARANIGADLLSGFRNKIVNGGFNVWQRGESFTAATGARYFADRFQIASFGKGGGPSATIWSTKQPFDLGQDAVPGAPASYAKIGVGGNAPPIGGGALVHRIEGVATLAGKTATLTFYAKSGSAGRVGIRLTQHFGTGGSPSAAVITNIGTCDVGNDWTKCVIVFTVPSVAGKTVGTAGNDYLEVSIVLSTNSDDQDWDSPVHEGNRVVDLARVSLVEGDASAEADPFSPRHPQQELALCQRYYQRYGGAAYFSFGFGFAQNQNTLRTNFIFPTTMRVAPSFSYGGTLAVYVGTATEISTATWQQATPRGGVITWNLPANVLTPGDGGEGRAQNDSTAYIAFDSEL